MAELASGPTGSVAALTKLYWPPCCSPHVPPCYFRARKPRTRWTTLRRESESAPCGRKSIHNGAASGCCALLAHDAASHAGAPALDEPPVFEDIGDEGPVTLLSFLLGAGARGGGAAGDVETDLALVVSQISTAVKRIAGAAASLGVEEGLRGSAGSGARNASGDEQKALDVVADELFMAALRASGRVAFAASEERSGVEALPTSPGASSTFAAVFDPLDGSRNIDAGIPTGTIFGLYRLPPAPASAGRGEAAVLQKGTELACAGYALYSSATVLVLSVGDGVHGFTLVPTLGEFVLSHPDMRMPRRGQIYSVNDARYFDWPEGLKRYIDDVRQGKGQTGKKYSARYICSLVGDFHRTLLYGGVAMNPRAHLRLVYEGNPLAFIAEQAGGNGWDGNQRVLALQPSALHERLPLFLGSRDDIEEMSLYKNVRQEVNPGYDV